MWLEAETPEIPAELQTSLDLPALALQTLVRRGVTTLKQAQAFLDPHCYTPASPLELPDMEKTVQRIHQALVASEPICVWGDFDVDGQTATSLLVSCLRQLGGQVSFHIPVRERESHGVNLPVLKNILDQGVTLVLTCDTGSAAHEALAYAKSRGVDVLVTDHHELPVEFPPALALVNPRRLPPEHPLSTLPGVGVAYKLAEALFQANGRSGEEQSCLDLAALGIVSDVATLSGDTRWLLQCGLEVLRRTQRLGLQAMMQLAELKPDHLTEEHIGFILGPRLNALGRLADANLAVELLTTTHPPTAHRLALQLETYNEQRRLLTSQVLQGALAQLDADPTLLQTPALVLAHASWHAGVLGIVASRLVERFGKPVVMLSAPPGEVARGSARSVAGVNITAAIAEQKDWLSGYGGHPMAAGLGMPAGEDILERITQFRRGLARSILKMSAEQVMAAPLVIDGYQPLDQLTPETVEQLERLAPFGAGNPPFTWIDRHLRLEDHTPLGRGNEHLLLRVTDPRGNTHRVIWWQGAGWALPEDRFDLAYRARLSSYRGTREVQIEWIDFRDAAAPPGSGFTADGQFMLLPSEAERTLVDLRLVYHPLVKLAELRSHNPEMQVWGEGDMPKGVESVSRWQLTPGDMLVIWSAPPAPAVLREALAQVAPRTIYCFGINPGMDTLPAFLQRLGGLVKYALRHKDGHVQISRLAAACAQRESAIQLGLEWLQARGILQHSRKEAMEIEIPGALNQKADHLQFTPGDGQTTAQVEVIAARLKTVLDESAAYRAYFRRATLENLLPPGALPAQHD